MKGYSAIVEKTQSRLGGDYIRVIDENGHFGRSFAAPGKIISLNGSGQAVSVIYEDANNFKIAATYSLPDGYPIGSSYRVN